MLKRFSAAKNSPVKISPKLRFSEIVKFKGLNINCAHRNPQKAYPWMAGTTSFEHLT